MASSISTVSMEECAHNLKCVTELTRAFYLALEQNNGAEPELPLGAYGLVLLLEHITTEADRAAIAELTQKRRV